MVEVTPGFKAGVTATVVGLGVGGGVVVGYVTGHPMTSTLSAIFPCQVCGRIRKYWA